MKKRSIFIVLLLLCMTGCSNHVPKIEEYSWIMISVQSGADGQAIAYGERGNSTLDTAKQIELRCTADHGTLTLTDETNHKVYTGTYTLRGTSPQSTSYEVVIDGKEGLAVVAMTTYHDKRQEATFIISLDDYAINFFEE